MCCSLGGGGGGGGHYLLSFSGECGCSNSDLLITSALQDSYAGMSDHQAGPARGGWDCV